MLKTIICLLLASLLGFWMYYAGIHATKKAPGKYQPVYYIVPMVLIIILIKLTALYL